MKVYGKPSLPQVSSNLNSSLTGITPNVQPCPIKSCKVSKTVVRNAPKPRSANTLRSHHNSSLPVTSSTDNGGSGDHSVSSKSTPVRRKIDPDGQFLNDSTVLNDPVLSSTFQISLKYFEDEELMCLDSCPTSSNSSLGKLKKEDELLLSQSDELYREALALCKRTLPEISRDSISQGSMTDLVPKGIEIPSLPSLSLISSAGSTPILTAGTELDLPIESQNVSQPKIDSPSSETDLSKVLEMLRILEAEKSKGSEMASYFGDFLLEKYSTTSSNGNTRPTTATGNIKYSDQNTGHYQIELDQYKGENWGGIEYQPPPSSVGSSFVLTDLLPVQPISRPQSVGGMAVGQTIDEEVQHILATGEASSPVKELIFQSNVPSHTSTDLKSNLLSFLDEVEKLDREKLFNLKFDHKAGNVSQRKPDGDGMISSNNLVIHGNSTVTRTLDTLIRQGSVELAREVMLLERQAEESIHNIRVLEETLLGQRELNIRNIKNSEKDLKKRLKIQQDEFDLILSRNQAFVDKLLGEKRALQAKCEKILKDSTDNEEKYQQQIRILQEKHLEEIKRLRKIHDNSEKSKKVKWMGEKTQEIRDITVKGLEPEVQRIIQRHQQEMSEMRAYYGDEISELEQRYARKQGHQLGELRDTFSKEKEEAIRREKETWQIRLETELRRQADDFEMQKEKLSHEYQLEKQHFIEEEVRIRETSVENIRKSQIKAEVEVENVQQQYDLKISSIEKRHEKELQNLQDHFESQRESWETSLTRKNDQVQLERETKLVESITQDKEIEMRDRERKLREEFETVRKEDEATQEARIKRLNDKFQFELADLEKSEGDLKQKLGLIKTELHSKEDENFSVRALLGQKEKEYREVREANSKMEEDRLNLTTIIRREFTIQIEALEADCKAVKEAIVEVKSKHKLDLESHQLQLEKIRLEKDSEIERIGIRIKQTLERKEETLLELSRQLEKSSIRIHHLEVLLEEQRQEFVRSVTSPITVMAGHHHRANTSCGPPISKHRK